MIAPRSGVREWQIVTVAFRCEQQRRRGLPNDVAPTDDDGMLPSILIPVDSITASTAAGAGYERRASEVEVADVDGMKARRFRRMDRIDHFFRSIWFAAGAARGCLHFPIGVERGTSARGRARHRLRESRCSPRRPSASDFLALLRT